MIFLSNCFFCESGRFGERGEGGAGERRRIRVDRYILPIYRSLRTENHNEIGLPSGGGGRRRERNVQRNMHFNIIFQSYHLLSQIYYSFVDNIWYLHVTRAGYQ